MRERLNLIKKNLIDQSLLHLENGSNDKTTLENLSKNLAILDSLPFLEDSSDLMMRLEKKALELLEQKYSKDKTLEEASKTFSMLFSIRNDKTKLLDAMKTLNQEESTDKLFTTFDSMSFMSKEDIQKASFELGQNVKKEEELAQHK